MSVAPTDRPQKGKPEPALHSKLDMPHGAHNTAARKRLSKVERARRYLSSGGVSREDSDDELGLEDLPWEWIYEQREPSLGENSASQAEEGNIGLDSSVSHSKSRKRKASYGRDHESEEKIIGARMGNFECRIGDCVLLKADGNNEAWVGLICEFMEDESDGKVANFMWFSTQKEIRNKEKKRKDYMPVSQLNDRISC